MDPIIEPPHSRDPEVVAESQQIFSILRGEKSAVEAYSQVMEKIKQDPEVRRLQEFITDHRHAIEYWKEQVEKSNIEARVDSGPWGAVVEAFVGSAKLLGNKAALSSLKQGEQHGLNEYKEMLMSTDVSPEHKQYIQEVLIPAQERHITSIDAMLRMH